MDKNLWLFAWEEVQIGIETEKNKKKKKDRRKNPVKISLFRCR